MRLSAPAFSTRDELLAAAARAAASPSRRAAHLADHAFRFDSASEVREVPVLPARPSPDAEWTLGETLDEIARRDAHLWLASSGVKLRHAHRMPHVARNVERHADALALWLRLGDATGEAPGAVAPGWDAATRLHAAWFTRLFAPLGPVALAPGVTVTDLPAYRRAVADRLALGPDAAGADALRATLAALFARHAAADAYVARPDVAWPMAA